MKEIYIDSLIIKVDDEDCDFLTDTYDITLNEHGYPMCKLKKKYKKMGFYSGILLHKLLVHPEKTGRSINVDHIDGDKLNNQKNNLRVCSHKENMRNRKPHETYANKETYSVYKGVTWHKRLNCWSVSIATDKSKWKHLGYFRDELSAAQCYNYHAKLFHGEYAKLNDLPVHTEDNWKENQIVKKKTSKYFGVSKVGNKWIVQIHHNKKNHNLGSFDNEIEAALVYNQKALELRGEKAKLNILN